MEQSRSENRAFLIANFGQDRKRSISLTESNRIEANTEANVGELLILFQESKTLKRCVCLTLLLCTLQNFVTTLLGVRHYYVHHQGRIQGGWGPWQCFL